MKFGGDGADGLRFHVAGDDVIDFRQDAPHGLESSHELIARSDDALDKGNANIK